MHHRLHRNPEELLREAGCSEKIILHCRTVRDIALEYAGRNAFVSVPLVNEGAMLHDIGRGKCHTILHAQQGADHLRRIGVCEEVARIVECHTGAGLTADECTVLGVSPRDCIPQTTEEKIVCHADNLVEGKRRVNIEESLASAIHLKRKTRQRIYHLAQEVEMICG